VVGGRPGRLELGREFDAIVLAGNIVPLLEEGTLPAVCARLAAHTAPAGFVVCGFGLDAAHLPAGCPVTPLETFEAAMAAAGLVLRQRLGGWDAAAYASEEGYVVTVHQRASGTEDERCG
jgi:hypothetical protein